MKLSKLRLKMIVLLLLLRYVSVLWSCKFLLIQRGLLHLGMRLLLGLLRRCDRLRCLLVQLEELGRDTLRRLALVLLVGLNFCLLLLIKEDLDLMLYFSKSK